MSDYTKQEQKEQSDALKFPLEFYPQREQDIIGDLVETRSLSIQHTALTLLPALGRLFSRDRGLAFSQGYHIMPAFWVVVVDYPGSSKSESVKCWYRELSKFNEKDDPENRVFYTTSESTTEALVTHIGGSNDGIYMYYDELTRFFGGMGQYKRSSDYDSAFWLSMFGGDVDENHLRVKEIRDMSPQAISICGTTQPETLKESMDKHMKNGLFDRFLFSVETNKIPPLSRNPKQGLGDDIYKRFNRYLEWTRKPVTEFKFNAEATDMLYLWHEEMRNTYNDDLLARRFLAKDIIYINRFAMISAILHKERETNVIDVKDAARAIKLYDFCRDMRTRAYNIVVPPSEFETMLHDSNDSVVAIFLKNRYGAKQVDIAKVLGKTPGRISQMLE